MIFTAREHKKNFPLLRILDYVEIVPKESCANCRESKNVRAREWKQRKSRGNFFLLLKAQQAKKFQRRRSVLSQLEFYFNNFLLIRYGARIEILIVFNEGERNSSSYDDKIFSDMSTLKKFLVVEFFYSSIEEV